MTTRRRRPLLLVAAVVLALAAAAGAVWWLTRGEAPEKVAERYLAATWHGDDKTACELAAAPWRHVLYDGRPYADCAAYADAATRTRGPKGFAAYEPDTDVRISTQRLNEDDGSARVEYVVELRYHGDDEAGFDALWQGGSAVDHGTIELLEVDGAWRVAGVDAG